MSVSTFRPRIGPIISTLGGTLMITGISLPLFFTSSIPDPGYIDPYPPALNGWQVISFLPDHFPANHDLMNTLAVLIVSASLLAVIIVSTSLLALFQEGSLLITRTRALVTFACIGVLCLFSLFVLPLGEWDGRAADIVISRGPGGWPLLLGCVLSAIGVGSASIGAVLGTFCGLLIGHFMVTVLLAPLLFDLSDLAVNVLFIGFTLLGSILGGWLLLRIQTLPTSK